MSWAGHRRALIFVLIAIVLTFLIAVTGIAFWYKAPSCSDGVQNQSEVGVDCGGPCALLCTSQTVAPTVRFARAVQNETGRVDFIAYVDNPNASSGTFAATYDLDLYDNTQTEIAVKTGTMELAPNSTTPLFIPGITTGDRTVSQTFLTFREPIPFQNYSDRRALPTIAPPVAGGTDAAPRVTVSVGNPGATPLTTVKLIVTVFDVQGTAIAASQTVIPFIAANGRATGTFTWNKAFSTPAAKIEVIPVVPL